MIKNGNVGVELDHQDEFVCMADTIKDFFYGANWEKGRDKTRPFSKLAFK